jgi:hypothetical protein
MTSGQGFDSKATPRWQMIPQGGFRDVAVEVSPSSTPIQLKIIDPPVVKLGTPPSRPPRPGYQLFRLEAAAVGAGFVEAVGGSLTARLQVSVKVAKQVTVKFYFVKNTNKRAPASARTPPDVNKLLTAVTKIYEPQTNITFKLDGNVRPVSVDLGADDDVDLRLEDMINKTYMTNSKDNVEWHAIAKHADPSPAVVNVFFCPQLDDITLREAAARDKQQGGTGELRKLAGMAGARTKMTAKETRPNRNVVMLSDSIFQTKTPEFVLAHEIGHYLGGAHIEDIDTDKSKHPHYENTYLMWGGGGPGDTFISRDEANLMNPSGT